MELSQRTLILHFLTCFTLEWEDWKSKTFKNNKKKKENWTKRKMSLCFHFDSFRKVRLWSIVLPQRFVTRSWFSAALSYAITFSGVRKVQVFERYLKSCLKVILVMESSGKIWIAFDISHPDYYFTTVRSLHSDLHVSSLSLSPGSLPWLYWLFSFYVICLSSFHFLTLLSL